mgnify:CR=1 FL=1
MFLYCFIGIRNIKKLINGYRIALVIFNIGKFIIEGKHTYYMFSYAQTAHVTIVSNHITIGQVINEIEKQTDYLFVFNVKDINIKRNVKVNAKDKAVNEVLNDIFKDTGIRHAIEGKNIMLINSTDKEKGAQQKDFLVTGIVKDENGEPRAVCA